MINNKNYYLAEVDSLEDDTGKKWQTDHELRSYLTECGDTVLVLYPAVAPQARQVAGADDRMLRSTMQRESPDGASSESEEASWSALRGRLVAWVAWDSWFRG